MENKENEITVAPLGTNGGPDDNAKEDTRSGWRLHNALSMPG
jgi:hypothetical protein